MSVRLFIIVEGDYEGVFIDSDKRIVSFPVSVRDQPASATFIFTSDAFKMAYEGVMLSSLYEKDYLQAAGDPKNIFSASLFLDLLLREYSENSALNDVEIDYSRLH